MRWFHLIPKCPLILAPRGEFSIGALKIRSLKKFIFIGISKFIKLHQGIIWHASNSNEAADIQRIFGKKALIAIASNLVSKDIRINQEDIISHKEPGRLRIIFLSRISKKKNLDGVLDILKEVQGKISFHIYGILEDQLYWEECEKLINHLSPQINTLLPIGIP